MLDEQNIRMEAACADFVEGCSDNTVDRQVAELLLADNDARQMLAHQSVIHGMLQAVGQANTINAQELTALLPSPEMEHAVMNAVFDLHRRRRRLGVLAVAAAVVLTVLGFMWYTPPPKLFIDGVEMAFSESDIQVPDHTAVELYYDGGSLVQAAPSSVIQVGHTSIVLKEGRVEADIQPQDREHFVVEVPDGSVHVKGTRFAVETQNDDSVVSVQRGMVRFLQEENGCDIPAGAAAEMRSGHLRFLGQVSETESILDKVVFMDDVLSYDHPPDWVRTRLVYEGLPYGSQVALYNACDEVGVFKRVHVPVLRTPCFLFDDDLIVHLTYKVEKPGPLVVTLWAPESYQATNNSTTMFRRISSGPAGKWHTISIPVALFDWHEKKLTNLPQRLHGLPCEQISLSSHKAGGLYLDRVWVTQE